MKNAKITSQKYQAIYVHSHTKTTIDFENVDISDTVDPVNTVGGNYDSSTYKADLVIVNGETFKTSK